MNQQSKTQCHATALPKAERKALGAAAEARTLDTSTWARMEPPQLAKRKA